MAPLPHRAEAERGAALIEFALVLPLFLMLVLGMFSGGLAYNRKLELTHAAREGARYGTTLPDDQVFTSPDTWATTVRDLVIDRAGGDLTNDQICVALVTGAGAGTASTSFVWKGAASGASGGAGTGCYDDGTTDATERRVQVLARRPAEIEGLVFSFSISLSSRATGQFEDAL